MKNKKNHYYVGKIEEFAKRKGWFFGAFADQPFLNSDLVEIAWQKLPNLKPDPEQKHYHKQAVEINIVISGWIEMIINKNKHKLSKGDFYVLWPESIIENITTSEDAEIIVIKAPSLPEDKFVVIE